MAKKEDDDIVSINKEIEKMGARISKSIKDLEPPYYLSTGIMSFDKILSDHGGIPGNIVMEIFGPNGTGKTSMALQIASNAQKSKMKVYYINSERAINASIVKSFDELKSDDVTWITPENGESALNIIIHILQTQTNCLVINDSIPACLPAKVEESDSGDSHVGALARLFSPFMSKAKKFCSLNNNILLQLNQERSKIGPMTKGGTEQPGGHAVKFYSDLRLKLEKRYPSPEIKSGEDVIGHYIKIKAIKSRCGIPYRESEIPIIYGKGIDTNREILDFASLFSIVVKDGSYISLYEKNDNKKPIFRIQGMEKTAKHIKDNPSIREDIENRIKEILA